MSRRVLLKPTHRYGCFSGCSRDVNQRARGLEWEVMWQDRKVKKLHMTEWVLLLKVHLVHQQHLSTEQWPWDIRCPAKPILLESSPIPLIFFPYLQNRAQQPSCLQCLWGVPTHKHVKFQIRVESPDSPHCYPSSS